MDAATLTMIENLQEKSGRSLAEWHALLKGREGDRHGALMATLKGEYGLSHGYANLVAMTFRQLDSPATPDDLVAAQYVGPKAALRPIHDRLVELATGFGADVEIAAKKTSVSLRRSKQFALIEAATKDRVDLGLNLAGVEPTDRLTAAKGMCTHKVGVRSVDEIDDALAGWLRAAYDRA